MPENNQEISKYQEQEVVSVLSSVAQITRKMKEEKKEHLFERAARERAPLGNSRIPTEERAWKELFKGGLRRQCICIPPGCGSGDYHARVQE